MPEESRSPLIKVDVNKLLNLDFISKSILRDEEFNSILQEAICYNQSMLAQYYFLLSQKHKDLKDRFKSEPHDKETLKQLYDDLEGYAFRTLKTVAAKNFSYIIKCFKGRHEDLPRVCLKLITGDSVISACRDRKSNVDEKYFNKALNTAFQRICQGEDHYLSNNIPKEARDGKYVNARIVNKEKLDSYKEPNLVTNLLSRVPGSKVHSRWEDCWERIPSEPDRPDLDSPSLETCYKSTLVIPLALKRSDLEQRFIEQFDVVKDNQERLIFGFLCFDHQNINFFDKNLDLKLGYIFADLLSLYVITRKMYTDHSLTFKRMTLEFFHFP
jgi:hypothetical protein